VAVIGAGTSPDVERFLDALHALPDIGVGSGRLAVAWTTSREHQGVAFFSGTEVVPARDAIGRVSADTPEANEFLQATIRVPFGHVRGGGVSGDMSHTRVTI